MPGPSPFADDWRDCLRAHYTHTVKMQDARTERTLIDVMHEVGFSAADLAEIKVLATLRADELPPDFVPDLEALAAEAPPEAARVFAAVAIETASAEVLLDAVLEEAVLDDAEPEAAEAAPPAAAPPTPDDPVQLSLF